MDTFSVGAMFSVGWETFKKRSWFFIGITALVLVISWLSGFLQGGGHAHGGIAAFIGVVGTVASSSFVDMGATAIALKAEHDVAAPHVSDMWRPELFWKYLFANILVGILVGVGFLLLIVPGVVLAIVLVFVKFLVVDRGLWPIEAMRESARITREHRLDLFLMVLVGIILNIVGMIALLVGLLVTIPVTMLAFAHAYRTLEGRAGEVIAA